MWKPPQGKGGHRIAHPHRPLIIELKLNKDAQTAMQQINLKNYAQRLALSGKPVTKVGINFDSTKGNITDWVVEE